MRWCADGDAAESYREVDNTRVVCDAALDLQWTARGSGDLEISGSNR